MNQLKDLLKDNIINKSELVIKRHEYLGLDVAQATFLAKIFVNNNESYEKININEIAKLMDVNVDTAKEIVSLLITKGLVKFTIENEDLILNFDTFIIKLLSSYSKPENDSAIDQKLKWIDTKVDFIINDNLRVQLLKIIENNNWDAISKVVDKFAEQNEQNFPLLVSLIQSALDTREEKENEIKSVLNTNWLK